MYLFFDTECAGIPKSWQAPTTYLGNWPRVIQLAWELWDFNGVFVHRENELIIPEDFSISESSTQIHGITTEQALAEGKPVKEVLAKFGQYFAVYPTLVAHSYAFHSGVVGAEFLRAEMANPFPTASSYCTMQKSMTFVNLTTKYGIQHPTLRELHLKLFGDEIPEFQAAPKDVSEIAKCFFALQKVM